METLTWQSEHRPPQANAARMTDEELHEAAAEAWRRGIEFYLADLLASVLARELVRRRKSKPKGRPANPMRQLILSERAAGARLTDLAERYRVSVRTVVRIVRSGALAA